MDAIFSYKLFILLSFSLTAFHFHFESVFSSFKGQLKFISLKPNIAVIL